MNPADERPSKDHPQQIVVARDFIAPRELLFRASSSAEHLKRWFCPAARESGSKKLLDSLAGSLNES
jgi:uncharacterized protein YndB with AHSA1/START domain